MQKQCLLIVLILFTAMLCGCRKSLNEEQIKNDVMDSSFFMGMDFNITDFSCEMVGKPEKFSENKTIQKAKCKIKGNNSDIIAELTFNMDYYYNSDKWYKDKIVIEDNDISIIPKEEPNDQFAIAECKKYYEENDKSKKSVYPIQLAYSDYTVSGKNKKSEYEYIYSITRSFDNQVATGSECKDWNINFVYNIDKTNDTINYKWMVTPSQTDADISFEPKIDLFALRRTIEYTGLGEEQYAVIKNDNSLWMWGNPIIIPKTNVPQKIWDNVASFSLEGGTVLISELGGTAYGWGNNRGHQLGYSGEKSTSTAKKLKDNIKFVAAGTGANTPLGGGYSLLLDNSNNLWAAGMSEHHVCGIKSNSALNQFTKTMENIDTIVTDANNVMALRGNTLLSWGDNHLLKSDGQPTEIVKDAKKLIDDYYYINTKNELCKIPQIENAEPKVVAQNVADYAEGVVCDAILGIDGSLWMKGSNLDGLLGNKVKPKQDTDGQYIKMMDNVVQMSFVSYTIMALKSDGSLWMWGANNEGNIDPNNKSEYIQEPIKIMDNVSIGK